MALSLLSDTHSFAQLHPFLTLGLAFPVISVAAVILNAAFQLLRPRDPSLPPVVFHWIPIVGSAISYGMNPYDFFTSCREKYGNVFTFVLLGRNVTVALGPNGSSLILNGKLQQVNAELEYTNLTTPVFGKDVIYDCPNYLLMEQKKFIKNGMTTDSFRRYVEIIVDEVTQMLQADVFKGSDVGYFEPGKFGGELTICTAAATLQGPEVRQALDKSFADLYHDLDAGFTPLHLILPGLPLPSYRKRDEAQRKMANFYISIMEERRETGTTADDMIASLQGLSYKDGRELTDQNIAHMMIALLMGGQHTSAATIAWALSEIGVQKDLLKALYQEQVKKGRTEDGTWEPLTYETLQDCTLLHATIKETLRVHPPIHSIMRRAVSDIPVTSTVTETDAQYVIPKGHSLLTSPLVAAYDSNFWTNASEYNPSRWLDGASSVNDVDTEKFDYGFGTISTGAGSPYLPFGAGRHRCIGEQFAHLQIGTILATLLRETEWSMKDDKKSAPDYTMLVGPIHDSTVIMRRRKNATA